VAAAFATIEDGATPFLLTVETEGRLIALLPLALHEGRGNPVLRFAGAPHNDMTDLMVLPGHEQAAAETVTAALHAAAADGVSVRLDDVDPRGVLAAADRRSSPLEWSLDDPAPTIDLRGEWRRAASPHRRAAWDRALRRLRGRHVVRFRRVHGADALRRLPELVKLRVARLEATGRQELPPRPFLKHAVSELAAAGACAITELLIDGQPAASDLYLIDGRVAMSWVRGVDPRWRRFPCGHLLLRASAEQFARDGFEVLDMGRGDEPYKFLFGAERRVLLSARLAAGSTTCRRRTYEARL
jgi:CelD/BcsL family acetyltransferase involved in cellulose biosynthesis